MIDLPPGLTDDAFDDRFERGTVIRTLVRFDDGTTAYKRLVVANTDCSDRSTDILHFLCTSKTDFYLGNRWVQNDCLMVSAADAGDAFDRSIAIDLRRTFTIRKSDLKSRYLGGELDFLGSLPAAVIDDMNEKITQSRQLSQEQKRIILPLD